MSSSPYVRAEAPNLGSSSGTPPNDLTGGGDLSPSESCNSDAPLAALVPATNPVYSGYPLFTISSHPTWLFYIPYSQNDIRYGEFTIHEYEAPHDRDRLYKGEFELPQVPGIVSFSIPNEARFSLEPYQDYRWRFKIHCEGGRTRIATGYIRRIDPTSDFEVSVEQSEPDIWYDSVAELASRLRANQTLEDIEGWNDLMDLIESDEIDSSEFMPEELVAPINIRSSD
ncbi:MAG: DUF928 domain-containing protein [Cyanobacteria bacterium P01_F01_bin.56]